MPAKGFGGNENRCLGIINIINIVMKPVIALLVFVWLYPQTYAQYSLTGTVTDNSHQTLAGAHVILRNTYFHTVTDNEGHFQFSGIKSGNYVLMTSFVGFETRQDSLDISGDQNLDLALKESAFVSDAVIISAVRAISGCSRSQF